MPLSLNSCIHAFVQLYKLELTPEQREQLIHSMKVICIQSMQTFLIINLLD